MTRRNRSLGRPALLVALALGLAMAGCGTEPVPQPSDPAPSDSVVSDPALAVPAPLDSAPSDSGVSEQALRVACGGIELGDPADLQLPDTPLDEEAAVALDQAQAAVGLEGELFDQYDWSIAFRNDAELVLFGRAIDETLAGEAPYDVASLELRGDVWTLTGWGTCHLVVEAPGFGNATMVLDPDTEPDPTSTELNVLINERDCANGEPPTGRQVKPVVVADGDRLVVTVLVEPIAGDASCPGNPWHPITITLDEPLGDRQVFDGSTVPPMLRQWPPTSDDLNQ